MNPIVAASALVILPFLLSAVTTWTIIRLAPRLGLLDHPAERKVHVKSTPLGGGLGIYVGTTTTLLIVILLAWLGDHFPSLANMLPELWRQHQSGILERAPLLGLLLAAGTIQMLLGLVDDWRTSGLSYQLRLLVEVGLVAGLISQGVSLTFYTASIWITAPVTVLWVVGLTNAFNFLDNMDALAGGVAFWASLFFVAVALLIQTYFIAGCFLILLGALAGFLLFNWPPARIFMGDAGSNFLGFFIAVLTVSATFSTPASGHITLLAPLCILAVPLYDSTSVILLRLAQGQSPFQPDKQHLSHRLVELGFSSKYAVLLIHLLCVTFGLAGLLLYYVRPAAAGLIVAQVGCMLAILALLEYAAARKARRSARNAKPDNLVNDIGVSPSPVEPGE